MPHHESGLLALKTNDAAVIDRAVKHYTDLAPHPRVELVRGAAGRGVWACFGSLIGTDVSAFQDKKVGSALAKKLGQPVWVGFAIGGYENHQLAMAFSPTGKLLWRDAFDLAFPAELAAEALDPFGSPARYETMVKQLRAERGFGRIGTAFGLDYFRILEVEAGDALFATDKKVLGKKGAKEFAKWLAGPFRQPEGDPGDGARAPDESEVVAWKFLGKPDLPAVAALLHQLLAHWKLEARSIRVSTNGTTKEPVVLLEGPGVRGLSQTLVWERFLPMVRAAANAGVIAWSWSGKEVPRSRGGSASGGDLRAFLFGQRVPPVLSGPGKRLALTATAAQAKKLAALRKALSQHDE